MGPNPLAEERRSVALRGRRCLRLAEAPAQVVKDYRYVEVQVGVHALHYFRPSASADLRASSSSSPPAPPALAADPRPIRRGAWTICEGPRDAAGKLL